MISHLLLVAMVLANTNIVSSNHIIIGQDPTPIYEACAGDTLTLRKQMGRELKVDGSRDKTFTSWIDRQNGRGFMVTGATGLKLVAKVSGKGWVYAPIGAKPCTVAPSPLPRPSQPFLFGANLSGGEAGGSDAVRPSIKDLKTYIDHGFKLIRYPFKPDRMTPARVTELRSFTDVAGARGVPVTLAQSLMAVPHPSGCLARSGGGLPWYQSASHT